MGTAIISDCGTYRYHLYRHIGGAGGACCFVMLNPSTADAMLDDPTIKRCIGFAKALGCSSLEVVNLFAYRSTDPDVLRTLDRHVAVGPANDHHIIKAAAFAAHTICAWGNHGYLFGRDMEVLNLLRERGVTPMALRVNSLSRQPAHPLYLPKSLRPVVFDV